MQNTYQDLITDLEGKKPQISGKLEGGKKFKIISNFTPAGDHQKQLKNWSLGLIKNNLIKFYWGLRDQVKLSQWQKLLKLRIDQL